MASAILAEDAIWGTAKTPEKVAYSFHYVFECEDSEKAHTAMCEDWELGVLFLKESERLGSDEAVLSVCANKVPRRNLRPDKDTRFLWGTHFPYNTWLVLGLFWPPKKPQAQLRLF